MKNTDILQELSKQLSLQVEIHSLQGDRAQYDEVYYTLRKAQIFARSGGFTLPKEVGYVTTTIAVDLLATENAQTCPACKSVFILAESCPVCEVKEDADIIDEKADR